MVEYKIFSNFFFICDFLNIFGNAEEVRDSECEWKNLIWTSKSDLTYFGITQRWDEKWNQENLFLMKRIFFMKFSIKYNSDKIQFFVCKYISRWNEDTIDIIYSNRIPCSSL